MFSYYHEEEIKTMTPVIVFNGYDRINIPTWKVCVVPTYFITFKRMLEP